MLDEIIPEECYKLHFKPNSVGIPFEKHTFNLIE